MKAVILAGGKGTRISEETISKPKPMVTIGGMPILWHIMKIYSAHGINDFVICLGYKGHVIKEFFASYALRMSNVTFDFVENAMEVHNHVREPWKVTLVETGLETMTGGRLRRIKDYLENDSFCMTYGDGLSDVDITKVIAQHRSQGKLATMTVCKHTSRFGLLQLNDDGLVNKFVEKPVEEGNWMNSGFYVMEPEFINYIDGDDTVLEREPIERAVRESQLTAYRHMGFFRGMDSLRDQMELEELWQKGKAPWKKWENIPTAQISL